MKLVIVESPTKAKTISRFLGNDFVIESSYGHVRDLPKSKLGVEVEKDYAPTYIVPPKAKKVIANLKKHAEKAEEIILATDEDREGEAIAWHISQALGLGNSKSEARNLKPVQRIVFHEITKPAIEDALKNPRSLDKHLIDAQQARRVLDRLVGYNLSPLLWKKVMRGLSAGRVQSVAVRLVVDREREREAFKAQEYWSVDACLRRQAELATDKKETLLASLWKRSGKVLDDLAIGSNEEVDSVLSALEKAAWRVGKIESKEASRNPSPPFTTSTLQQAAGARLGYSAKQTMVLAQQLYEGVDLPEGREGLITYMRTDSLNLSQFSRERGAEFIVSSFGQNYSAPRAFKTKSKGAQEAHEAIRPTDPFRTPEKVKAYLDSRQLRLYSLIWSRFVASQMAPARFLSTSGEIETGTEYLFRARGLTLQFDGYLKVWSQKSKEEILPELSEGEKLELKELKPERHETQPPPRYSEATLVKALEEYGIGRPSTYAPTLSTIQERGYVERDDQRRLHPTQVGFVVNDLLVEHFPNIVDLNFTANLESELDEIAEGKMEWVPVIREFYEPFKKSLDEKEESISRTEVVALRELGTDPETGKPVTVRIGRFGPYVQRGSKEDEEKPDFASLPKGVKIDELTMADVTKLFELPRKLGTTPEGEEVEVNIGRFGPYVKIGKEYSSIREDDPHTVTLERALEIVKEEKERKGKKVIKEFEGSDIKILDGRYGPYITDGKKNARIPKDKSPEEITLPVAQELIEKAPEKGKFKRRFKKSK
jgi:DNA topoisomerase-1